MLSAPDLRLLAGYCAPCRTITAPLDDTVAFLRKLNGAAERSRPPREEPRSPPPERLRTIDERDRVFAFLLMLPLELSEDVRAQPLGVMSLILACCAILGLTIVSDGAVADKLALVSNEPLAALLPHLVTNVFVHVGLIHLLGNVYFLYAFGRLLEERLGAGRFIALFLVWGAMGSLAFTLVHLGEPDGLAGASGAIAGVLGCYLVMFPWRMVGLSLFFTVLRVPALFYLGLWFVFQVVSVPYQEIGTAYSAHAGGFVGGILGGAAVRAGLLGPGRR
jgi:membrane associated rhomboid family serine protease